MSFSKTKITAFLCLLTSCEDVSLTGVVRFASPQEMLEEWKCAEVTVAICFGRRVEFHPQLWILKRCTKMGIAFDA